MNYKKIIVFILAITLLSSIAFADNITIVDSSSGVDFQLYLARNNNNNNNNKLYGIGSNAKGELGKGDEAIEYEELVEIESDMLIPKVGDSSIKRTVTTGADFSVIVKNNNKAYATGENYFGQLATGDVRSRKVFTEMKGENENKDIVSVSAGADFVLLLNSSGAVYGAGDNAWGQIKANGNASYNVLTSVYDPANNSNKEAIAIATGSRHSVILLEDGSVITLGDNEYHQRDVVAPAGKKIEEIATGSYHTLIRLDDNTVWGVGSNENQQLVAHVGGGSVLDQYRSTMVQLVDAKGKAIKVHNPNERIRSISAGYDFSLITVKGNDNKVTVIGIGNKYKGQLGEEAKIKVGNVVEIDTIDTVQNITASWLHSIIMGEDKGNMKTESKGDKFSGTVEFGKPIKDQNASSIAMGAGHVLYVKDNVLYGSGANAYGQLGLPTYSSYVRKIPFEVDDVGGIKQIATGATHSVILGVDGSVWVTGYNYSGQLGLGDNNDRSSFTKLDYNFDSTVIAVAAGGDVTLILTQNGTVYAMGDNTYNQIDSTTASSYNTPIIYSEGDNVTAIAVGARHTLVLKADGKVVAKGQNVSSINGYEGVEKIATSAYHSLLLLNGGSVYAVGKNTNGQLGLGSTSEVANGIVTGWPEGVKVKGVAAGYNHSVFLTSDGIYIAGNVDGTGDKTTPTKYANAINPQEIATGWLGNIVKTATSILTIGNNEYAQRGSFKGEESKDYDDEIANLSKKKISAGNGYTMVVHSDGTLWGIGKNDVGQLGLGNNKTQTVFINIMEQPGLNFPIEKGNIADIQSYGDTTFILTRNGELYATGKKLYTEGNTIFGQNYNRFTNIGINNVKKLFVGMESIFLIKNDGSLWVYGAFLKNDEFVESKDEFSRITVELNDGEFIKNILSYGSNVDIVISDGTNEKCIDLNNGSNIVDIYEKIERAGMYRLKDGKLFDWDASYYKVGDNGEMQMVTTEGTNEIISNVDADNIGKSFTEDIKSFEAGDSHIVVLTESGQIYAAGDNTYNQLGNETLNNNGVTRTKVFVPLNIKSIAPTTGVVVK